MCFDANSYNRLAGIGVEGFNTELNDLGEKVLGSERMISRQPEEKKDFQDMFTDSLIKGDYDSFCTSWEVQGGEYFTIQNGKTCHFQEVCDIVHSVTSNPPPVRLAKAKQKQKPKSKSKSKPKPKPVFMESLTAISDERIKCPASGNINYFI